MQRLSINAMNLVTITVGLASKEGKPTCIFLIKFALAQKGSLRLTYQL